jgi:hypothetical protein
MTNIEKLKQEAEELFPLPESKFIAVSGGVMDCGKHSRALAFTFVRRTDYINSANHKAMDVLRRLLRSLDVRGREDEFADVAEEGRELLISHGIQTSYEPSKELLAQAAILGITRYPCAQKYGDDHPIGSFVMTLDVDKAKLIEKTFGLTSGNAPDGFDIAAIHAHEDPEDMSVWVDYEDEDMYIEIMADEEDDKYTMVFGPGRLNDIVETLKHYIVDERITEEKQAE